jgi:hypothetical protein
MTAQCGPIATSQQQAALIMTCPLSLLLASQTGDVLCNIQVLITSSRKIVPKFISNHPGHSSTAEQALSMTACPLLG